MSETAHKNAENWKNRCLEAEREVTRLREFAVRVHEECDKHITGRQSIDTKACGDCPVWTLRSEAGKAKDTG